MPLVQVLYIRFAYPATYRVGAVAYANTFAASAAPGSVKQVMADAALQSVNNQEPITSYRDSAEWTCVTYSFVRHDFLPTFVPYLRNLYRPTLTRSEAQLIESILAVVPNPPVVLDPIP